MPAGKGEIVEGSFTIEQEVLINAPREKVFDALCDVSGWWRHTFKEGPAEMVFEPVVGGRFMQTWGDDEGALFGTVVHINRPEMIRMSGQLGTNLPASNLYQYELEEKDGGTLLKLTHRVAGMINTDYHDNYIAGWGLLWESLRAFVEEGKRWEG